MGLFAAKVVWKADTVRMWCRYEPPPPTHLPLGGAPCAVPVRKVGYCGPGVPHGQGARSNYCVAIHRTTQILTQSKNSDNELKQTMFSH